MTKLRESGMTPRLWRNRDYLFWLASDSASAVATAVYAFLVPLVALIVTDDPVRAGLVAAAGQVARVLAVVPGGVLADRHDRRLLMVLGGLLGAGLVLLIALAEGLGRLGFWALLALNAAMGVRAGLLGSVSNPALKSVVAREQLPTALSANQGRDAAISMGAGPAGGALLVLGPVGAFLAVAGAHLAAVAGAIGIRADLRPRGDDAPPEAPSMLAEAREGFAFLWGRHELRDVLVVATLLNLGLNAAVTTVIFNLQQEGVSTISIGLVSTVLGMGILLGSLVAPALIRRFPTGRIAVVALLLASGAVIALPLVSGLPAILTVLGVGVLGGPAVNAGLMGYFMAVVPQQLLGRAGSASELMSMGAMPLAPVIAGFGLGWVGFTGTLLVCAAICALAVLVVLASRPLRELPGPEGWAEAG